MSRKAARETAMKMIFERSFGSCTQLSEQQELLLMRDPEEGETPIELNDDDKEFIDGILNGVADNEQKLNEIISAYSLGWKIDRMPRLDKVILQLALYELFYTDISEKIVINEAVELAKRYSTADSPSFINGLMGKAVKERNK